MKQLLILILLFGTGLTICAQETDVIVDCQNLILKTFKHGELNPIYQSDNDSINNKFRYVLLHRDKNNLTKEFNYEIESIFKRLYDNSTNEYEDSPDYRRLKMRRSICFATIALISDFDKAYTFIEYSKVSLIESIEKPDVELLENEFLGLLIIETMLKIEENKLAKTDIEKLDNYLILKKDILNKQYYLDSKELIKKLELIIK